jgi:hypothetical protein
MICGKSNGNRRSENEPPRLNKEGNKDLDKIGAQAASLPDGGQAAHAP